MQYTAPAAEAIKTERTPTREAAADHPRAVVEGFHSVARPLPKGPMVEVTGVSTPAPVVKTQPRPEPAAAVVLFTHAPDYTWIAGEMQHWRKSWRLRYTNLDETDAYGGSLTLVGDERLLRFRDGGHYRLQGRLVEDENLGGMAFQVEAVQPVE